MAKLKEEYTDVRNRTHTVEHVVVPGGDNREQIVEELLRVLTKPGKNLP